MGRIRAYKGYMGTYGVGAYGLEFRVSQNQVYLF